MANLGVGASPNDCFSRQHDGWLQGRPRSLQAPLRFRSRVLSFFGVDTLCAHLGGGDSQKKGGARRGGSGWSFRDLFGLGGEEKNGLLTEKLFSPTAKSDTCMRTLLGVDPNSQMWEVASDVGSRNLRSPVCGQLPTGLLLMGRHPPDYLVTLAVAEQVATALHLEGLSAAKGTSREAPQWMGSRFSGGACPDTPKRSWQFLASQKVDNCFLGGALGLALLQLRGSRRPPGKIAVPLHPFSPSLSF